MIEKIHLGILVSESQSMVMFPMANKKESVRGGKIEEEEEEIDMNSGFYKDFEEENIIQICCTWNDALADGVLTYFIDGEHSSQKQEESARDGIEMWDTEIKGIELEESDENNHDIKVGFQKNNDHDIAGQTLNIFDGYGFINNIEIIIFEGTEDFEFNDETIEQITEHEMGHALGLGHANFAGNFMAAEINYGTETISDCEIKGVYEANSWYLGDSTGAGPTYPENDIIGCDT